MFTFVHFASKNGMELSSDVSIENSLRSSLREKMQKHSPAAPPPSVVVAPQKVVSVSVLQIVQGTAAPQQHALHEFVGIVAAVLGNSTFSAETRFLVRGTNNGDSSALLVTVHHYAYLRPSCVHVGNTLRMVGRSNCATKDFLCFWLAVATADDLAFYKDELLGGKHATAASEV